jgi:hypothetical protein
MASLDPAYRDFASNDMRGSSIGLARRLLLPLLMFYPPYWTAVNREADLLISAFGASRAASYAREESEDALAPAWAAFMRRVRASIERRAVGR